LEGEEYVTGDGTNKQVLFVSPPGLDRELYASALGDAGFGTFVLGTAFEAETWLAHAEMPAVIVMDLLPEPDQTWALIARRLAHSDSVPVVIFTSMIRPDGANRRKARSFGCAAFVAKPCSLRQLVEVVSRVDHGERGLEIWAYAE
jgi:DNA-binding NtrC family response regulator